MKRIVLLLMVIYCAVANAQLNYTNESYYYYKGETINLTINNNRFVVYFNTNMICLDTIKKRFTTNSVLNNFVHK